MSLPTAICDVGRFLLAICADDLSPFGSETPSAEDQALDRMANGFGANVTNQASFMASMFVGHKHNLGYGAGRTGLDHAQTRS